MTISVIVPIFNGERWISDQLTALSKQTYTGEWELIIADNGSTDDTVAIAEGWRGRVSRLRLLDASGVRGQSHARNCAVLAASGDALLFTDQDDIVCPDWIAAMSTALSGSQIVTGPIIHFVDGHTPSWSGVHDSRGQPTPETFDFGPACNLGIRRGLFLDLGGFDESITRSWEDVDLGIRAARLGFATAHVEGAVVLHRRPASAREMWRKEFAYGRGRTILERRYAELSPEGWIRPLLRRAGWVAVRAPYVVLPDRRRGWVVKAAGIAGRFAERIRPST